VQMALAGVLPFANINYKKIHQSVHKICLALFWINCGATLFMPSFLSLLGQHKLWEDINNIFSFTIFFSLLW
jgi:hypothetical protein